MSTWGLMRRVIAALARVPPGNGRVSIAPAVSFRGYQHATEQEHQTAEQFAWAEAHRVATRALRLTNASVCVAVVSLVLTVLAILAGTWAAAGAWQQVQYAKLTLIGTNRAWIDISLAEADLGLAWADQRSPVLAVTYKLTDFGNSPAIAAAWAGVVLVTMNGRAGTEGQILKKVCPGLGNSAIFVRETRTIPVTIEGGPDPTVLKWIEKVSSEFPEEAVTQPIVVPLTLAVCVTYKIAGDEDHLHHTLRLFDMGTKSKGGGFLAPSTGIAIPLGQASIHRPWDGDFAD